MPISLATYVSSQYRHTSRDVTAAYRDKSTKSITTYPFLTCIDSFPVLVEANDVPSLQRLDLPNVGQWIQGRRVRSIQGIVAKVVVGKDYFLDAVEPRLCSFVVDGIR